MMTTDDSPSTPQWMPLTTAAVQVGRSVKTLRRWIKDGKIPARMESGRWLVNVAEVQPTERPAAEPAESVAIQPMLSTLHDLANQLAETAERAARAETQVEHLEEKLAELRARIEQEPKPAEPPLPDIPDQTLVELGEELEEMRAGQQQDEQPEPLPHLDAAIIEAIEGLRPEQRPPWWRRIRFQLPGRQR